MSHRIARTTLTALALACVATFAQAQQLSLIHI